MLSTAPGQIRAASRWVEELLGQVLFELVPSSEKPFLPPPPPTAESCGVFAQISSGVVRSVSGLFSGRVVGVDETSCDLWYFFLRVPSIPVVLRH